MEEDVEEDVMEIAKYLHRKYEHTAKKVGWKTQEGTSVRFEELPEDNKQVMIEVAQNLLRDYDVNGE